jgi:nitroreductase
MNVKDAIDIRRAYRSLIPVEISTEMIEQLTHAIHYAPSCFNNQPWHFVFVSNIETLKKMHNSLSKGNEWACNASMIIVACVKKEDDCIIYDREYFLFDTGIAVAFVILQATELGLVAHPIAGYSPKKVREILQIPEQYTIINLIIVGKHTTSINPVLSEKQKEAERIRPSRKPLKSVIHHNMFNPEVLNE